MSVVSDRLKEEKGWMLIKFSDGGKVYTTCGIHMSDVLTVLTIKGNIKHTFISKEIEDIVPITNLKDILNEINFLEIDSDGFCSAIEVAKEG